MRVPVRRQPETRISDQQLGYARGAQPLDLSPIVSAVQGFQQQLLDEQDDRQRVELNRRLLTEVNDLQLDFEESRRDPEQSPIDFAQNINTRYNERHTALLRELREGGYSQELLDDFEGRLGTVRQGFFERGVGHQMTQLRSRAVETVEDVAKQASQYTAANPDAFETARDMLRESIRMQPDLLEDEREQLEDQLLATVRDAGAGALAIQRPEYVIETLDPQGLMAPARTAAPGATGAPVAAAPAGSWQSVATTVASELGLDPVDVAAVMSYESAGTFSPTIMGGTGGRYMGLIQFGPEERRTYGITESSTPEEWTTAILGFMRDRGFRRGMSILDFYSTINAGSPGRHDASDGNGTVRSHAEQLLREHRTRAASWLSSVAPAATPASSSSVQLVDIPASTSAQQNNPASEAQQDTGGAAVEGEAPVRDNVPQDITSVRTGNALLDDLTGPERLQLVGRAYEQMTRRNATLKAEMDVRLGNIMAEAMQNGGQIATPMPTEQEVLQAYPGPEGPQRWAQLQQTREVGRAIGTFSTRSAEAIQRSLEDLEPEPGSPTYATELQVYESAQRAANALLEERERDPAAYAMKYFPAVREAAASGNTQQYYAALDRVYESLGIDVNSAPVMSADAIERLTDQYKDMPPTQRREFIRQNMAQMGEARFRRFVRDMEGTTAATDARVFALLSTYPGPDGAVGNVYNQVLEGREIIATDPARRPNSEQVRTRFRAEALAAIAHLNPEVSAAIQEAAEALYVQAGGRPEPIDAPKYREALRVVLGGSLPADMTHGVVRDRTILPARTNRAQFQAWIERQTMRSLTELSVEQRPPRYGDLRTAVPVETIIDEGVFVMVSPGQYMIKLGSDGRPVMTSTGRPFLVNIHARDVLRR